jgi:activator of 2-hydroxyglutaryl-CoA dehydratase
MYRLGIDIGSVSINAAILNENGTIIKSHDIRHKGKPFFVAKEAVEQAINEYEIEFIATTGTGAKAFASLIGAPFIN